MHLIEVQPLEQKDLPLLSRLDLASLIQWVRLSFILAVISYLTISQFLDGKFYNPRFFIPIYFLFSVSLLIHFAFVLFFEKVEFRKFFFLLTAVVDTVLIGVAMGFYGQTQPTFLIAFLCNIIFVGCYVGPLSSISLALFSAAVFNSIISLNLDFADFSWSQLLSLYNGSFLVSAVVAGLFQKELTRVTQTIESQKEDIKTLQDLNQLIVENVGSGLLVADVEDRIVKSNRAAAKILSDISLAGKNLFDVLPGARPQIKNMSHQDGAVLRFEMPHLNYEGTRMILEVIATPLIRRPYGYQGHVVLIQNLTEVKNYEENLKQQEKMAAIGAMAAGIAHEIRNPLASISGSIQLLASSLQPQAQEDQKLISIVIKEIDRLNRLIAEFLEFVRPPLKVDDPVELSQLLAEISQVMKSHPQVPKGLHFELNLKSKGFISGHYDKLKQAFLNIVMNAVHAVEKKEKPQIQISIEETSDEVTVSIRDNGVGMSRDTVSRIFVPFFTTKSKGTGLGLAITHKIFEAHEAQIRVESSLGEGTQFFIVFKRRSEQ